MKGPDIISGSASYAERLIGVIQAFAEGPEVLTLKELGERLHLPPSSVHRALEPLVELGLVERAPRRRYRMGPELYRIAARVEHRFELVTVAKPLMAEIVAACGETCLLAIFSGSQRRILLAHKVDTKLSLRFKFDLLQNITPVWGSLGRAILAWLPPSEVQAIMTEAEPSPVTGKAVPSLTTLQQEFDEIRRRGIAVSHGQRAAADAIGVSAPFFDATGQVRGGLGVVAPEFRMAPDKVAKVGRLVAQKAAQLSDILGHRPLGSRAG